MTSTDPDWLDGYTGAQEAKEDHLASRPPLMPGGESTSAQLRRVRQELAETAARLAEVEINRKLAAKRLHAAEAERNEARAEAAEARESCDHWLREFNLANAEQARLRSDLAAERAASEQLRKDYAEAADELGRTIPTSKEKTMPAIADDGPVLVANRSIFRNVIPVNGQWHTLHLRGPIVHVATRHEDCVEIWFIEDSDSGDEPRTLRVYGTGHAIDEPEAVHVGSAVTPSGRLVWHLMERIEVADHG